MNDVGGVKGRRSSGGPGWERSRDGKWYPPGTLAGAGWWRRFDDVWDPPEMAPGSLNPQAQIDPVQVTALATARVAAIRAELNRVRAARGSLTRIETARCYGRMIADSTEAFLATELVPIRDVMVEEGLEDAVTSLVLTLADSIRESGGLPPVGDHAQVAPWKVPLQAGAVIGAVRNPEVRARTQARLEVLRAMAAEAKATGGESDPRAAGRCLGRAMAESFDEFIVAQVKPVVDVTIEMGAAVAVPNLMRSIAEPLRRFAADPRRSFEVQADG